MSEIAKLLWALLIDRPNTTGPDGTPAKLQLTTGALAVIVLAMIMWTVYKVGVVQQDVADIKADVARCVRSTDRIESVLIDRGARAALPTSAATPMASHPWASWSIVPQASAEGR